MRATCNLIRNRRRVISPAFSVFGFCALILLTTTAGAQDGIAPFKLVNVSGEFSVRYLLDEWQNTGQGQDSRVSSDLWQEELRINTSSYIYHPAFLQLHIGGGPLLVQNGYKTELDSGDSDETLFSFNALLNFMNRSAYPFGLFYRRDYPEITSGLSGRFLAKKDEYGISGVLRQPLLPVQVLWDASRRQSAGSGDGTTLDDIADQARLVTNLPYGDGESVGVRLNWNRLKSRSGNAGLPIQDSVIKSFSAVLDGDNTFGSSRPATFRQSLSWHEQETEAGLATFSDRLFYKGSLDWTKSDSTTVSSRLSYLDNERDSTWSRAGSLSASIKHRLTPALMVSADTDIGRDEAPGFSSDVIGGRLSTTYRRNLPFGSLGASAGLNVTRTDRDASTDTVSILDEPIVLVGTVAVDLKRDSVVSASVVVTNEARTQTFAEGLDYRLITIGATTSIERIISGVILDGETVIVSYDVLTGGTVEYESQGKSIAINLGLFQRGNIFVRLSDNRNRVLDGIATIPLNDMTRFEVGGRLNIPLASGWGVGGNYRYIEQDEDISPYVGNYFGVYVRSRSYWRTTARLSLQRSIVENENSPEDVDVMSYRLNLTSRIRGGLLLSYDAEYREDVGGTILSEDWRHSLRLDWRYRLVTFRLHANQSDVSQDDFGRDTTRISLELRRRFY